MSGRRDEVAGPSRSESVPPDNQSTAKSQKKVTIQMSTDLMENEDEEDVTCCPRITICKPKIRDLPVTNIVFNLFGHKVEWAMFFWMATVLMLVLLGWGVLFFLLGDTMLPGGPSFGLFFLVVFAYTLGWVLHSIPYLRLPPLVGMLLAGIILRNTDLYNIYEELGVATTSKIRTFCLTFVMIRAGFQVTTTALKTHGVLILFLALVPSSVEVLGVSLCCRFLLDYPWDWSFMSGTVVSAMSPTVVVNGMLSLAESGYGEDKGLMTLLSTAATIDDVHVLCLFSAVYSIVFRTDASRNEWWSYFLGGLRDVAAGLLAGALLGLCLTFFPHRNDKYAIWYRMTGLILASLICTTAASRIGITGGGYLGTLVAAFIAIKGWKIQSASFDTGVLQRAAYVIWHLVQPILVGVIGADIDFRAWSAERFRVHVACIAVGLTVRSLSALSVTLAAPFSWKERLFVIVAWLPKGTMQAALAPMAFERAKDVKNPEKIELAVDLLRISVIAIVLLAALGSMAINIAGPLLLNQITVEEHTRERELSYLRLLSLQPLRTPKEK